MILRTPAARGALFLAASLLLAAPSAAKDLYQEGLQAVADGNLAMALDKLETAVSQRPDNLRISAAYRQAAIAAEAYDRCIAFFTALAAQQPEVAAVHLNLGFAHVDKIPAEGAITQVLLANTALGHFSKAIELEDTWLGRYTRGNSYLYWPAIFGRTPLGIADLERAIEMARAGDTLHPYHAHAWAALGDGHWRLEQIDQARRIWQEGAALFPGDDAIAERLSHQGEALDAYLEEHFDSSRRVATDLQEIFDVEGGTAAATAAHAAAEEPAAEDTDAQGGARR